MGMDSKRIDELISIYRDGLLEDTIPFWTRHSVDRECGGFLTFLDRDGSVYGTDKPVWLQGRIVWVYSRLYNEVEKRAEWLEIARGGLDFLLKHCFDGDGRMFFLMTRDGTPLRMRRYVFSEVFAVMGLAEFARASGEDWARAKAAEVFDTLICYHTTPGLLEPKEIAGTRPSKSHAMPMILVSTSQIIRQVDDRPIYRGHLMRSSTTSASLSCGCSSSEWGRTGRSYQTVPKAELCSRGMRSSRRGSSWKRGDTAGTASFR